MSYLKGRGRSEACTMRGRRCGALPVGRIRYDYPGGAVVVFGGCRRHMRRRRR